MFADRGRRWSWPNLRVGVCASRRKGGRCVFIRTSHNALAFRPFPVNDLGGDAHGGKADNASTSAADRVVAEIRAAGGQAVSNYDR